MVCKTLFQCVYLSVLLRPTLSKMEPMIVNGADANIQDWPFIAFILYSKNDKMVTGCGSSLLSSQTLLTAAHCLDDITQYKTRIQDLNITVLMGHSNMYQATMIREVIDYQTHFMYRMETSVADIGVAFLDRPVKFIRNVRKVLLQTTPVDNELDRNLMIAGWGAWSNPVNMSHITSETLQFLHQNLIPRKACRKLIPELEEGTICAGKLNSSNYPFSGDSGGPLVRSDGVQVGIVSYKLEGDNGLTVYTSVPSYIDWIMQTQEQLYVKNCGSLQTNFLPKEKLNVAFPP